MSSEGTQKYCQQAPRVGEMLSTCVGPPMGEAGLEAIPGSPTVRGLTATRPGTPTTNQNQGWNQSSGRCAPGRAPSGQRCLSLHVHTCAAQNPVRHPALWPHSERSARLSSHGECPVRHPHGPHAGTAATGPCPSAASTWRPSGQASAALQTSTKRPPNRQACCRPDRRVLGDGSRGLVRGTGESQGLGRSGSRGQEGPGGKQAVDRQEAALSVSYRGPASLSVPGKF